MSDNPRLVEDADPLETDGARRHRETMAALLREQGMLFVGIDVIGGFVTEINVTSPTGIRELDKQFNCDIASDFIKAIEKRFA